MTVKFKIGERTSIKDITIELADGSVINERVPYTEDINYEIEGADVEGDVYESVYYMDDDQNKKCKCLKFVINGEIEDTNKFIKDLETELGCDIFAKTKGGIVNGYVNTVRSKTHTAVEIYLYDFDEDSNSEHSTKLQKFSNVVDKSKIKNIIMTSKK